MVSVIYLVFIFNRKSLGIRRSRSRSTRSGRPYGGGIWLTGWGRCDIVQPVVAGAALAAVQSIPPTL